MAKNANKLKRSTRVIIALCIIALCAAVTIPTYISYSRMVEDDHIVRQYLEDIAEGYSIWLVGSSRQGSSERLYIFRVGAEDTLEIVVRGGEVESSRWLRRIPHMWSGSDLRFTRNEQWR